MIALAGAVTATAPQTKVSPDVQVCIKAAAATDHTTVADVDRDACVCATRELHVRLRGGDFDLHQKMLEVIGSGADKKSFDAQMSDIMVKRGMTQPDVDAFLTRSKKAEAAAQAKCNTSPLINNPILPSTKPAQ
jgi:hypothetical protein